MVFCVGPSLLFVRNFRWREARAVSADTRIAFAARSKVKRFTVYFSFAFPRRRILDPALGCCFAVKRLIEAAFSENRCG